MTIYVIQFVHERDDYYATTDNLLEEDYGYFTSQAKAEEKIKSVYQSQYDSYVNMFERYHTPSPFVGRRWEDKIAQYEQDLREWEILWAAGIEKEEPVRPRKPVAKSYEDWLKGNDDFIVTELALSEDN